MSEDLPTYQIYSELSVQVKCRHVLHIGAAIHLHGCWFKVWMSFICMGLHLQGVSSLEIQKEEEEEEDIHPTPKQSTTNSVQQLSCPIEMSEERSPVLPC